MTDVLLARAQDLTRIPGVRGAMIVDAEAGVAVASDLADGVGEGALAALADSLFRRAAEAALATGQGRLRALLLEAEGGHLVVVGAGPLRVVVLADRTAQLGLVRVQAARVAEELGR
jgi:predicted regulator of Ras-like GTPase activity (Roadblock/LC7/MglB family)